MIKSLLAAFAAICLIISPAWAQTETSTESPEDAWTQEVGYQEFKAQYASEGAEKTFKASNFLNNCLGPSGYAGFKICGSKSLDLWDEKLNLEYKRAMGFAKAFDSAVGNEKSKAAALLKHQRLWIAYRDSRCTDQSYDYLGGSLERGSYIYCKREMTAERTVELWHGNDYASKR